MTRIVVRSESEDLARETCEQIARCAQESSDLLKTNIRLLGPAKATVEKLRGKFRFHLLLRNALEDSIQPVIRRIQTEIRTVDDVQWIVDIDPQDML